MAGGARRVKQGASINARMEIMAHTSAPRKVLLVTFGSLGDLHPFVALAHALAAEGLAPIVATSGAYRDHIVGEGLAFVPIRPDAADVTAHLGMELGDIARRLTRDDGFLFRSVIFPHLQAGVEDLLAAAEGVDAIVSHAIAFPGRLVAEKLGLPNISVLLSPLLLLAPEDPPRAAGLPFLCGPQGGAIPRFYNRLIRATLEVGINVVARPLTRMRQGLTLPKQSGLDLLFGARSCVARICLFSPLLLAPDVAARHAAFVAGHSFSDRFEGRRALDPALAAFLDAGPAPIIFSLGSFVARDRQSDYRVFADAARHLDRRAVLLVADDDLPALAELNDPMTMVAAYAPHSLVFPRGCALVHHGGVGTSGQALRAGKPQIVIPFFGDQFDNAMRLKRLGVARILKGATLEPGALSREIERVLTDPDCVMRSATLGPIVAAENGAKVAAQHIVRLLAHDAPPGDESRRDTR